MANLEIVMDETTVELVVISGAQQSDITSAINAHSALDTGVHGAGASTVASAADVAAAVTTHNASTTAHALTADDWAAIQGAASPSASNVLMSRSAVSPWLGIFNVRDYGSTGDGIADDTAEIQAAITACSVAGGGVVSFPDGNYLVSDTLSLVDMTGVVLDGHGTGNEWSNGARITWAGAVDGSKSLFNMTGSRFCSVSGLLLRANTSAAGTESNIIGIDAGGSPTNSINCVVDRCYFMNFATGIRLGTAVDSVDLWDIENCFFQYGAAGVGVQVRSTNSVVTTIRKCTMMSAASNVANTSVGVKMDQGGVKIFDLLTQNNKYGIQVSTTIAGIVAVFGLHSENDSYALYCDAAGSDHQKYSPVIVNGVYCYNPLVAFAFLGNLNFTYMFNGVHVVPVGVNGDILVSDAPEEVWLTNVTLGTAGAVRKISDNAVIKVYGHYGVQSPTAWGYNIPGVSQLSIGGGTTITAHLSATAAFNPDELVDGASALAIITVIGAVDGDPVTVGYTPRIGGAIDLGALQISARVYDSDVVLITLTNVSGVTKNYDSGTLRVDVWKH